MSGTLEDYDRKPDDLSVGRLWTSSIAIGRQYGFMCDPGFWRNRHYAGRKSRTNPYYMSPQASWSAD
jgi:hypothetical protein